MIYNNESIVIDESNAMDIINEAYFGKTKEVLAIEKAVHDLRDPYINGYIHNYNIASYVPVMKNDPNIKKLSDTIKDAFGFGDVFLKIKTSSDLDVYTMPTSICIDLSSKKLRKSLKASKSGFRYDKNDDIILAITLGSGVLVSDKFTDAEITAAILHEVGHNFSPAITRGMIAFNKVAILPMISIAISNIAKLFIPTLDGGNGLEDTKNVISTASGIIITTITSSNKAHRIMNDISVEIDKILNDLQKKYKKIFAAIGIAHGGIALGFSLMKDYIEYAALIFMYPFLPLTLASKLIDRIGKPLGYEDEKFADAFAASYGYGEELNSFLYKANGFYSGPISAIYEEGIIGAIKEVYMLPYTMVINAVDEHPNDAARAKATIRHLQRELDTNSTLDNKTKSKIKEDIKNIEYLYDMHENEISKMKSGTGVKQLYQKTMYKIIGGDIRGKFIATHVSDDIDKAYAATRESVDVYDNKERIGIIKENTDMAKSKFKNLMDF